MIFNGKEDRLIQTNIVQKDQFMLFNENGEGHGKNHGFNVVASMLDTDYDNDDNRYIKFKFRQLVKNSTRDRMYEIDIPMVKCENKLLINPFVRANWYYGQMYCPELNESHYLEKNYYQAEYSIFDLQVHYCNIAERQA